ncbi:MAG: OB-fold domain-containing protein [Acidimicrobiales bacterium]
MVEPRTVIVPEETDLTRPYWDGARAHELRLQHCDDCSRVWHPPLPHCPGCGSAAITWRAAQGSGVVHSVTITHQAAHPAFAARVPYAVVVVRLTEGVLIIGNVLGAAPSTVAIGQPVTVAFEEVAPGVTLPQFTLT